MNINHNGENIMIFRLLILIFKSLMIVTLVLTFYYGIINNIEVDGILPLQKLKAYEDNFSFINALFTGLGFSGLIITVLEQKENSIERGKEFKQTIDTRERIAELAAYKALLNEYNKEIGILENRISEKEKERFINTTNQDLLRDYLKGNHSYENPLNNKLSEIKVKKEKILINLERYLQKDCESK